MDSKTPSFNFNENSENLRKLFTRMEETEKFDETSLRKAVKRNDQNSKWIQTNIESMEKWLDSKGY